MAGSLREYLQDIAALTGRELRTDILDWRATVATDGSVTYTNTAVRRVLNGWTYFAVELRAACTTASDLDDIDQIRFNLKTTGDSEDWFSSDIELMGLFAPSSGEAIPIRFDPGGRKIGGGRDVELTVTGRASITTQRVVSVKVACLRIPENL